MTVQASRQPKGRKESRLSKGALTIGGIVIVHIRLSGRIAPVVVIVIVIVIVIVLLLNRVVIVLLLNRVVIVSPLNRVVIVLLLNKVIRLS